MKKKIVSLTVALAMVLSGFQSVYGLKVTSENVALNKPTSCDSEYADGYRGAQAVDGNINSAWSQGYSGRNGYIIIDLLEQYSIGQIVIAPRWDMDWTSSRQNFEVQLSNDSRFGTYEVVYAQGADTLEWRVRLKIDVSTEEKYRYLRLQKTDGGNAVYSEIEVYPKAEVKKDYSGTSYAKELGLMAHLGFVDVNTFKPDALLTRGELVQFLLKFAGLDAEYVGENKAGFVDIDKTHAYFGAMQQAYSAGWITPDGDGRCYPNDYATQGYLIEILAHSMGLGEMMDYMDINTIAQNFRLFPSDYKAGDFITNVDLLKGIYRSLKAKYPTKTIEDGSVKYNYNGGDYLKNRFNIVEKEGVVTEIKITNLAEAGENPSRCVEVDRVRYVDGTGELKNYLGYRIEYFVDTLDDSIIAYTKSADNAEYAAQSYSVAVTDADLANRKITVKTDSKSKIYTLASGYSIIYNGTAYYGGGAQLLKNDNTELRLLDNDGDGDINVLFVDAYQTYLVKSAARADDKLYIIGEDNAHETIDLASDNIVELFDMSGVPLEPEALEPGDVIDVWKSMDGYRTKIIASINKIEGTIETISHEGDDEYLTVNGQSYKMASVYDNMLTNLSPYAPRLEAGLTGKFYLNSFGEIVGISTDGYDTLDYAYLVKAVQESGISDKVQIKVFTNKNEMKVYDCAERIKVDKAGGTPASFLPSLTTGMIKMRLEDGMIKEIDTLTRNEQAGETVDNSLTQTDATGGVWNTYAKMLYKSTQNKMIANVDTSSPLFYVPRDGNEQIMTSGYDEYYKVVGVGTTLSHMTTETFAGIYGMNRKTKSVDAFLKYTTVQVGAVVSEEVDKLDPTMVVSKVSRVLNEFGEEKLQIEGFGGSRKYYIEERMTHKGYTQADVDAGTVDRLYYATDLKPGDIIHYAYEGDNITGFVIIFKYERDHALMESKGNSDPNDSVGYCAPWYAYVDGYTHNQIVAKTRALYSIMIDRNGDMISLVDRFPGNVSDDEYFTRTEIYNVATATVYKFEDGKVKKSDISELNEYNYYINNKGRIMIITQEGNISYLVAYETN